MYDLRIEMEDFDEKESFAEYKNFKVDSEKVKFTSTVSKHLIFNLDLPSFLTTVLLLFRLSFDVSEHTQKWMVMALLSV